MNILNEIMTALLYVYVFSIPLLSENFNLEYKGISAGDMLLFAIILIYLLKIIACKESRDRFIGGLKDFFRDSLCLFMLILFLAMSISVIYAKEKGLAISEAFRFAVYLALFFIIKYEIFNEQVKENIIKIYLGICSILTIMGIIQYVTGIGLAEKFVSTHIFGVSSRIDVTLVNPNNYGAFLILAIFPVIMLAINERERKAKIYYIALSLLLFVNIGLTSSRNAYLGFLLGCLILVLIYSWKFIYIFCGAGIISLFIPKVRIRFLQLFDPVQNKSRITLWKTALHMIKDHPLFGVGNGNFIAYYNSYVKKYPELKYGDYKRYPTHNSYLKIESELGVLGIVSFIGMLVAAWLKVKSAVMKTENSFIKTFYTGFLASMAAFYFMNFFDNLFFVPRTTVYFYILLGISQSFLYNSKSKENWRIH